MAVSTNQNATGVPLGGSGLQRQQLTGNYQLAATDDGKLFWAAAGTTFVITVPAGLTPPPSILVMPPATGSITLHPTGGALLAGAAADVAINITNYPSGIDVIPYLDQTDQYALTLAGTAWSALTGAPTDNTAFNTWAAGYQPINGSGTKQNANYTFVTADNNGFQWLAAQATDKTFTVNTGLPNGFKCRVGYLNNTAAAGRLKLVGGAGVSFNWCSNQATGALLTATTIFIGTASANNMAICDLVYEGASPGGTFMITPVCGVLATV